jgi:LmbE family N-acetylglucosaminyl deacetylase
LNFPEHFDEGLTTHNVQTIYLWDTEKPNIYIDISDVLDKKISALLSHKSQFPSPKLFAHQSRQIWQDFDGKYREEFRRLDIWA